VPPLGAPVPPADDPLSRDAVPPDGLELFGAPSLAVPCEALLPEGDGFAAVEPELPLDPLALDSGVGKRLLAAPSLAVPWSPLLLLLGFGTLLVPAPPEPPVGAPDEPAELPLSLLPDAIRPDAPDALACTPSESSVCWSSPDALLRSFLRW